MLTHCCSTRLVRSAGKVSALLLGCHGASARQESAHWKCSLSPLPLSVPLKTKLSQNKVVTQDQTQLIRRKSVRFGWDEHRKRFSPPVHNEPFPKLDEGKTAEAKFHKRFLSKTAFLAHVAVQTRPDVLEHAVRAARRQTTPRM
jgi:hypothetical protein